MKLAVVGLGRMGGQIVKRLVIEGHQVVANARSKESVDAAVKNGALPAYNKQEVVDQLKDSRAVLWLMIPSDAVETELDEWVKLLPKDSIVVDGGNSDYRLTAKRYNKVKAAGHTLVDVGTSGGILGLEHGFSMMVGGDPEAVEQVKPILESLSKPHGGYQHFGPSGSGHYVKMVHNAIEYGMMESMAEGYRLLKEGPYKNLDLAAAGQVWQRGSIVESQLNELTRQALAENPELNGIEGFVAESGEARWTLETAKDLGIPAQSIQAAFDVRLASQKGEVNFATKLLAAMRNKFGGHALNK